MRRSSLILVFTAVVLQNSQAGETPNPEPVAHVYARRGDMDLTAYVFSPGKGRGPWPAIVILHGGGWTMGDPSWAYGAARRFAGLGLVAIAGQYRLSGKEHPEVTPLDAMADARALFRWVRENRDTLNIDPGRVAGYGWSAGAHLVASAAALTGEEPGEGLSCVPDAMILSSPAVSLHDDQWFKSLLGDRASVDEVSPDSHIHPGMPPTLILQGRGDTVTPLVATRRFHEAMLEAGNESRLVIYDGVGHLFTSATEPDTDYPRPDPEVSRRAKQAMEDFLRAEGFLD